MYLINNKAVHVFSVLRSFYVFAILFFVSVGANAELFTGLRNGQTVTSSDGKASFYAGGPTDYIAYEGKLNFLNVRDYEYAFMGNDEGTPIDFGSLTAGTHKFTYGGCQETYDDYYYGEPYYICGNYYSVYVNVPAEVTSELPPKVIEPAGNRGSVNGTTKIFLSDDRKFDRPVIVLQGYENKDISKTFDAWYSELDVVTLPGQPGMLAKLRAEGFDIVLYRYNDVDAGIAAAAANVESMLMRLNDADYSSVKSISLLGQSMGGVVARYALLELASKGIPTKVKTWISYDSPHQGAIIPQTIVDNIGRMYDKIDVSGCGLSGSCRAIRASAKRYRDALSAGTSGDLILNTPAGGARRAALLAKMTDMGGFPSIPSLAIANGSYTGTQGVPASVKVYTFEMARPKLWGDVWFELWSDPAKEDKPGGYADFYSDFSREVKKYDDLRKISGDGSRKHTFIPTASALSGQFTKTLAADVNGYSEKHLEITPVKSNEVVAWLKMYQP